MAKTSTGAPAQSASVTPFNDAHIEVCVQATYQIEAICNALMKAARDDPDDSFPYLALGLASRLRDLNGVIMETLDCEADPSSSLECIVYGSYADSRAEMAVQ